MTPLPERYRAARSDPGLAVLEGLHALKHALRFGAEVLDVRARASGEAGSLAELRSLAETLALDVADRIAGLAEPVASSVFDALAPRPHATGVIALARRPAVEVSAVVAAMDPAPLVLLERPTHHGNIGAVVRVAAAAGATGVLTTGRHDPWHPAAIRGGAGLQFALPVAALAPDGLNAVLGSDRPVVALDPEGDPLGSGSAPDDRGRIPPRAVLVFGSERTGVTAEVLARADRRIAIPMRPGVSSLNLATAVAIALYSGR